MEKWGWLFFQIGELKVPAVAQPFSLVCLDAETMAKALKCSSQRQNLEGKQHTLPPVQTFPPSAGQGSIV